MAQSHIKIKVRNLRRKGKSIKEIARLLDISVSTASFWCRDIQLTIPQIEQLIKRGRDGAYRGRLRAADAKRIKRIQRTSSLFERGRKEIGTVSKRDFFIAGVALYWGEGFKTEESGVGIVSGDPLMIQFMIKWFGEFLNCNNKNISLRLTLNLAYRNNEKRIKSFWARKTGVPLSQFHKTMYIESKNRKIHEQPEEYHGTLRIVIRKSRDNLRLIKGWVDGIAHCTMPA